MIPTREQDVVINHDDLTLTLLAEQRVVDTGGNGCIRQYALLTKGKTEYQIDAILDENDAEVIDYFDIFDADGRCLNLGDPWFLDDETDPDATLAPALIDDFLDTLVEV